MLRTSRSSKSGATSIYTVVISTLLFGVITLSFIRIVISEANRTTSDELAQSAYDSALAGVEDSKIAIKKYYECQQSGNTDADGASTEICPRVNYYITCALNAQDDDPNNDCTDTKHADHDPLWCDSVGRALGRIDYNDSNPDPEVFVQEEKVNGEDTVQAYTCVTFNNHLADYRSTLSSSTTLRVIPLKAADVNAVSYVQISWFSESNGNPSSFNFGDKSNFAKLGTNAPTPPTISAQIIQTASSYKLSELDTSVPGSTDRATVFLVPTDDGTYNPSSPETISADILANSNDHYTRNDPQKVRCASRNDANPGEFACSAKLQLPTPINGTKDGKIDRNANTFFLILSLPYGQPTTDFQVQLLDATGSVLQFEDAQIAVDSTGRANDMFARVEARIEFNDIYFPYPEFAIQLTSGDADSLNKNFYVTSDCWYTDNDGSGNWVIKSCDDAGESKPSTVGG